MLKSAFKTLLATELDDPSDTSVLSLLGDYLDEGIEVIASRFKWNYLNITKEKTLLQNTNTISVENILDILKVTRKDIEDVIPKSTLSHLMSLCVDFEDTGFPSAWFEKSYDATTSAFILQFDKLASENYDLLISCKKELGGIGDSDHIPFPINIIPILKNFVRSLWYLNEENIELHDRYESKFERGLAAYILNYGNLSAERPRSSQNSDLSFASPRALYDINLDKDRIITE